MNTADTEDEEPTAQSAPFDLAAPIVFGTRVVEHSFPDDLRIDGALGECARRQPELMANYGMLAVEARHRERQMRAELERVEKAIEFEIRMQLDVAANMAAAHGEGRKLKVPKPTQGQLRGQVITDERYRRKEREYLSAAREAEKLTIFEESLRQRAAMLHVISDERGRKR